MCAEHQHLLYTAAFANLLIHLLKQWIVNTSKRIKTWHKTWFRCKLRLKIGWESPFTRAVHGLHWRRTTDWTDEPHSSFRLLRVLQTAMLRRSKRPSDRPRVRQRETVECIISSPILSPSETQRWSASSRRPYKVTHWGCESMCSIMHETLVSCNPPCCCARSVETFSRRSTDKCALVPLLATCTFFFPPLSYPILPPLPNRRSPSLSLSDRLSSVTASAGIPHRGAAKQGTLADTAMCACVPELISCASAIASCLSVGAFVVFVISSVGMEVCSAHECVSHISRLRI